MGGITIGGLATGLDTNSIIEQLTNLERRRRVDYLEVNRLQAETKKAALQSFNTRLASLLGAIGGLKDAESAIARSGTSSNEAVAKIAVGSSATAGSTEITVNNLARGAIAVSGVGVASADATIASGAGTFEFSVGGGATQSIAIDASTTLAGLASAINDLGAGVSAQAVNLGTTAAPDYRLRIASVGTGTSSDISVVNDGTDVGIAVSQAAQNASLTVSGFATPIVRETNTIDDVVPGATLTLQSTGSSTVTIATDDTAAAEKVEAVVKAYNDLVSFVNANSAVTQDTSSADGDVDAGPLAFDSTVRSILSGLRSSLTDPASGLGTYSLLAEVGISTKQDGTLSFDSAKFTAALNDDEVSVRALFGGTGSLEGVFDRAHSYVEAVTASGGLLEIRTNGLTSEIKSLSERIDSGERAVDAFEAALVAQFASLEALVSGLQSQGAFLTSVLSGTGSK